MCHIGNESIAKRNILNLNRNRNRTIALHWDA